MKIEQIYRQNDWWDKINWSQLERDVRRLQGRIYRATKKGDKKGANNLMKLLVRSESAKLLAIYTITQKNKGRNTPGIDGKVYLTTEDRMELSKEDFEYRTYKFQPVLRRYIPKALENWRAVIQGRKKKFNGKMEMRPLGLMTVKDRVMAIIISFALIAKWEALMDPGVMGFRPGRSTQDAIQMIYSELIGGDKVILDADINKFFDNIRHGAILDRLDVFHGVITRCLRAGIIDNGKKHRMTKGIVQGSPVSPVLANIALHGLQQVLGTDSSAVVYADDLIIMTRTRNAMRRIIPEVARFMRERGLNLKREKTRITGKRQGFNFLGFTIEQPRQKLYVKPQRERVKRFLDHLRLVIWSNKQMEQRKFIALLNPIIRGWAMYYRYSDASQAFSRVDDVVQKLIWRWCERRHNGRKGKRWIYDRYYGKAKDRKWTFKVKKTGYALVKASDVKRLKYKFKIGDMSPLNSDPRVKELWKRRGYEEIRCAML
ncbi:MAG: reverse transcriptase domain-containing protein [Patescibacteria group bacterium]|nr:reverse transcriptase domain-containing protein [Patescibacteria group bacterium]